MKVRAQISPGRAWPAAMSQATRATRTRVLPVPAPAMTATGPWTRCAAVRWRSSRDASGRSAEAMTALLGWNGSRACARGDERRAQTSGGADVAAVRRCAVGRERRRIRGVSAHDCAEAATKLCRSAAHRPKRQRRDVASSAHDRKRPGRRWNVPGAGTGGRSLLCSTSLCADRPRPHRSFGSPAHDIQRQLLLELVTTPPPRATNWTGWLARWAPLGARSRPPSQDLVDAGLAECDGDTVRASAAALRFEALWPIHV